MSSDTNSKFGARGLIQVRTDGRDFAVNEIVQRGLSMSPTATLRRLRQEQRDKIMEERRKREMDERTFFRIPVCKPAVYPNAMPTTPPQNSPPNPFMPRFLEGNFLANDSMANSSERGFKPPKNFHCPCGKIHAIPNLSSAPTAAMPSPVYHQCGNMPGSLKAPPYAFSRQVSFAGMTGMRGTRQTNHNSEAHYRRLMIMAEKFISLNMNDVNVPDDDEILPCGLTWAQVDQNFYINKKVARADKVFDWIQDSY
jgi:hypothetical protein